MLPPEIASVFLLSPRAYVVAAVLFTVIAFVRVAYEAQRRSRVRDQTVDLPLERLRGLSLFAPEDEPEAVIHVPVLRAPTPPPPALAPQVRQRPPVSTVPLATLSPAPAPVIPPLERARPLRISTPAPAVRLPALSPVRAAAVPEPERRPSTAVSHDAARQTPAFPPRNRGELPLDGDILMVEDDVALATMYGMLLTASGYSVRHAHDGLEGIAMVRERRPALILLDMMMPRMDGLQFLEALRAWPKTIAVPVVVLSNADNAHLVDRALALGAVDYLVKAQTRPQVLVSALPHWLRGNRALSAVS